MSGPRWVIPVELVRAAATSTSAAFMTRQALNHVVFRPHVELELSASGFIATVTYETYRKDELRFLPIRLAAVPQENFVGGQP